MPTIPDKKQQQITFAQDHLKPWTTNATALALTPAQLQALGTAVEAASKSYETARGLRNQAKAATSTADRDIDFMNTLVGDAVKGIRLKAESSNNPALYDLAQIPAPATPTAALPPTKPDSLRAVIGAPGDNGGAGGLTIQWKPSPSSTGFDASTSGVLFTVRRRLAGQTGWTILGTAKPGRGGSRGFSSFTDFDLPANPQGLEYTVQGTRANGRSPDLAGPVSNIFKVAIGADADGVTSTAKTSGGLKMAA